MPHYLTALSTVCILSLGWACTKKDKEEESKPKEVAEEPSKPEEKVPADEIHLKAKAAKKAAAIEKMINKPSIMDTIKPGEEGQMFLKAKKSPITIMKVQAIANKEKRYVKKPFAHKKAEAIFDGHCMRCHGTQGLGDGPEAADLPVAPTNLKEWDFKYGNSLHEIVYTLTYGQAGGEMPAFSGKMDEADLWLVAQLVTEWQQNKQK